MSEQVALEDSNQSQRWWEGGNLHDKTILEWLDASGQNRLATSVDIVIALKEDLPTRIEYTTGEELMRYVTELMTCITGVAIEGEATWDLKVADVAIHCAQALGFLQSDPETHPETMATTPTENGEVLDVLASEN